MATPETTHSTAAPPASESVIGRREVISGQTARWVLKEYPKHGALQWAVVGPKS